MESANQPDAGAQARVREGVPVESVQALLPIVYQELRGIARRERRQFHGGETLITTALINEAYLRLNNGTVFASRAHFLHTAAVAIRCILVDKVRAQLALKRGAGAEMLDLEEIQDFTVNDESDVLRLNESLDSLAALNPRLASVVECRFFAGFSEAETAEALGVSIRTVQRDWVVARAWLQRELSQ